MIEEAFLQHSSSSSADVSGISQTGQGGDAEKEHECSPCREELRLRFDLTAHFSQLPLKVPSIPTSLCSKRLVNQSYEFEKNGQKISGSPSKERQAMLSSLSTLIWHSDYIANPYGGEEFWTNTQAGPKP